MAELIDIVLDIAQTPAADLPTEGLQSAQLSLFDWLVCGLGGIDEPLAGKLRDFAALEGGAARASLFGGPAAPARMAALVNGATSHALDYDDTHFAHIGHLSVGIYPAALAAGEEVGASAADVAAAFLIGAEGAIRIGMVLGAAHYNRGFHQTATAGAFGATLAAGRLYGLSRDQMRAALGLCATRASGLKSQFGTMGKPFNAGIAAANGIECARLAALGMTSAQDGIMGDQGFVPTHTDAPQSDIPGAQESLFPAISYKFHACCHGTHAMIEALLAQGNALAGRAGEITALSLRTNPRWLKVCDIKVPRTGLEVKFSYAWLAGMVIGGQKTGAFETYSDACAADPALAGFAQKVVVTGDAALSDMQAGGRVQFADGSAVDFAHDLALRPDAASLRAKLAEKAGAVLGAPGAAALAPVLGDLAGLRAAQIGATMTGGAA